MPARSLRKPVSDGAYIVEWAKFVGSRERPRLKEWVYDVGKIKGDWFTSSDGKTRKKVSSEYFIVRRRIRSEVLKMPGEKCICEQKRAKKNDDFDKD